MRANTLLPKLSATMSAAVLITFVGTDFPHKEVEKAGKEKIAYVNVRRQDKEEVAENAARQQPQQVENSRSRRELTEQIVEYSQRDNNEQPDSQQKNRKY